VLLIVIVTAEAVGSKGIPSKVGAGASAVETLHTEAFALAAEDACEHSLGEEGVCASALLQRRSQRLEWAEQKAFAQEQEIVHHKLKAQQDPSGQTPESTKPNWTSFADRARWLVYWSDYGIGATICSEQRPGCAEAGDPFGNVMAISDGFWNKSTGTIYTYLPEVDPSPTDLAANPSMSITFTEKALPGGCPGLTAEDPTCTRLVISGYMTKVPEAKANDAIAFLFDKHPDMKAWPAAHGWYPYWIAPENITSAMFFLDMYGPSHPIEPDAYFAASPFGR
jgi:hypothetical protein